MKSLARQLRNEEGSVIVVALMILVVLTIIGISATDTTTVELQIATNDKFHKIAFYNADAGVYATPKLISAHVDDTTSLITIPGINYLIGASNFDRQIYGYDPYDGGAMDIRIVLGVNNWEDVDVDVERTGSETLSGGGAEFASGSEGIGVGSAGGVAIFYRIDSFGDGPANSTSNIGAVYRKVLGVPGGL
ncbi:MAG: pilus assembly PilX N-terminal domain-containing protein [Candidatus Latescibacteria bacterium]|nr:pilus assembly PilX N-terminal domain-containing protein [Candidatus Latescibacterota bacterium]